MRQTTAILVVGLCALAGCQGGGAQEPYDGVIAAARPLSASVPAPQDPEAAPMASAVDVPWTIALLSDAEPPAARARANAIAPDAKPPVAERIIEEAHFHVAVDPRPTNDKPATPKACGGVVKTRS
jgi:hypothetical protein